VRQSSGRRTAGHKRAEKKLESLETGDRTPNCFLTTVYSEHGLPL
jgi:hypothetical protein